MSVHAATAGLKTRRYKHSGLRTADWGPKSQTVSVPAMNADVLVNPILS